MSDDTEPTDELTEPARIKPRYAVRDGILFPGWLDAFLAGEA